MAEVQDGKDRETVLIAALGTSPAVLTEVVWALAEGEGTIPSRVIVVTTLEGRKRVIEELLENPDGEETSRSVWSQLREALAANGHDVEGKLRFGQTGRDIHVLTVTDERTGERSELPDIRSSRENEEVGDSMVEVLRSITEDPDTTLIASLAGGRKTMGVLLYAAACMLGRSHDRAVHVLVSAPYENPTLVPRFYFPQQARGELVQEGGSVVEAGKALIEVADVPLLPMRELFQTEYGRAPGAFRALAARCRDRVSGAPSPKLCVWSDRCKLTVDDQAVELAPKEHLLVLFLTDRLLGGSGALGDYGAAVDLFRRFWTELHDQEGTTAGWLERAKPDPYFAVEDLSRLLHRVRGKLSKNDATQRLLPFLPRPGNFGLDLSPDDVEVAGE